MQIKRNASLKSLHTFGMEVKAAGLAEVKTEEEFLKAWQHPDWKDLPKLILGGGSNVLFVDDFKGLVILNRIKGREVVAENKEEVKIKIKSGENWHELVLWAIDNGWGGIENLSLIPGTVGAAPMQNIGAYGVELKEVFHSLEAINLANSEFEIFNSDDCRFGYRESVFKLEKKNHYFISSVTLKLSKKPQINIEYGDIRNTLEMSGTEPLKAGIKEVSNAVIKIRQQKLPDPVVLGNAGSFFKNPVVDKQFYDSLKLNHPTIPGYPAVTDKIKIPAAWLIEQSGWKGKKHGHCGSHEKQALVIVNYGQAKGQEAVELSKQIQSSVFEQFGVKLEPEVNII